MRFLLHLPIIMHLVFVAVFATLTVVAWMGDPTQPLLAAFMFVGVVIAMLNVAEVARWTN